MWHAGHGIRVARTPTVRQTSLLPSREAATECSPRRKPWVKYRKGASAPKGAKDTTSTLNKHSRYSCPVTINSTTLYRPVGQKEFDLIRASGFLEFPPRLPEQPFFYPVLNEEYATQIARDWNTKDERSGFAGYVLRFNVRTEFLDRYQIRVVGDSTHREYWIPASELKDLNENIVGEIELVTKFRKQK